MALDTYSALQAAVLKWLFRPGDTLISADVPDMIALFEAEARRQLKTRQTESGTTTLVTVAGTATVALPSDFIELRAIKISSTNPVTPLRYVTPTEMDEVNVSTGNGKPSDFTIQGTNLRLAPTPDAAYTLTIDYMQALVALSNTAPSNWLLTNHPDAYLFGTLAEAEPYIGHDERFSLWKSRRDEVLASILAGDIKARWGGGVLQIRTDVGNP